jgi:hypothetical protein
MSDVFRDAGMRVATQYSTAFSEDKEFALDPTSIIAFIDIIKQVVEMWANCKMNGKTAKQTAENPTVMQRLLVRRRVKETMGGRAFRDHGDRVIQALIETGRDVDDEYLQKLIDES